MCGIVGIHGLKHAPQAVRHGLERLEYRGYDSAGIAWLEADGVDLVRTVGRVAALPDVAATLAPVAIGHTRWATHGGVRVENAHPHLDGTGRYAVVHNGTLESYNTLRAGLERQGHVFQSDTDTEILAHRYERERRDHDPLTALRATLDGLEGAWATLILDPDAQAICFARHRTPLVLGLAEGFVVLASDVTAIVEHTRDVIYLDDGDHGVVTADGIQLYDRDGQPKPLQPERVSWEVQEAEKAGHTHFMLKEIHDAPTAINQCLGARIRRAPLHIDLGLPAGFLDHVTRIRLVACGTSLHAALMARHFIEQWARVPTDVESASEVRQRPYLAGPSELWIGVSQSGETLDTLEALRYVHGQGGRILAVTNVQGSSLQRLADATLHTRVGPEVGVAATKTLVGQATALALFALALGRHNDRLPAREADRIATDLARMPRVVEQVLDQEEALAAMGHLLARHHDLFWLGRGIHVATAMEAALKFKEITYLHAEGLGAAELRHGPFALLTATTPCIFFLANDAVYPKLVGNLLEVRARDAPCYAITQGPLEDVEEHCEAAVALPATDPLLACIPMSVAGQLVAYHAAAALERDIDKPRNLAKSVTVE